MVILLHDSFSLALITSLWECIYLCIPISNCTHVKFINTTKLKYFHWLAEAARTSRLHIKTSPHGWVTRPLQGHLLPTQCRYLTIIIHVILSGVLIGRETITSLQITAYE